MASLVYHSRSGCYFAQFYDGHKNPTRKTVSLKTKKKRIAERALAKLEDAVALREFDPWAPKQETADELGVLGWLLTPISNPVATSSLPLGERTGRY